MHLFFVCIIVLHLTYFLELKPIILSVIKDMSKDDAILQQRWKDTAKSKLAPLREYFLYLERKHSNFIKVMKAAKIFNPSSLAVTDLSTYDWKQLREILKQVDDKQFDLLKEELPKFQALTVDLAPDTFATTFFNLHARSLPTWKAVFALIALELPSSAPAERGFSVFQEFFREVSKETLQDLCEISVMRRYNFRTRTEVKYS